MSDPRLYTYAIIALRRDAEGEKVGFTTTARVSETDEEARQWGLERARDYFPEEDGWERHDVTCGPISGEIMEDFFTRRQEVVDELSGMVSALFGAPPRERMA